MKYALQGLIIALLVALLAPGAEAASGLDAITVTPAPGGGQTYSINIQILILMTVLTLLPAGLLMMTSNIDRVSAFLVFFRNVTSYR